MDGILIIDKPAGLTSHDVVGRVRRILQTRRVGHTGTLDPFATGVMVVLVGKATRLAQFLDKDEKEYEALVRFGFETDTGDRTGSPRSDGAEAQVSRDDLERVLPLFKGKIQQVPPMYSAKKVDGRKLYELARKGLEIERKPVTVEISELELCDSGSAHFDPAAVRLRVVCSAGTYIRTLAEDIARAAGSAAHLTELKRNRAGKFDLSLAVTLDHLAELDRPEEEMVPLEEAVCHLPALELTADRIERTRNGLSTRTDLQFTPAEPIRMSDAEGKLVAVGVYNDEEKTVQPKVVLV